MRTTHTTKGGAKDEEAVRLEEEDTAASKVNPTTTKLMRIVWIPKWIWDYIFIERLNIYSYILLLHFIATFYVTVASNSGESLSSLSCLLSAPACCSFVSCHSSSAASASRHATASLPVVTPPLFAPPLLAVPFFISGTVASCSTRPFFMSPFIATGMSPIRWCHHLSLCNGLFLLLRPLVGAKRGKPIIMPTDAPAPHKKVSWQDTLFPRKPLADMDLWPDP